MNRPTLGDRKLRIPSCLTREKECTKIRFFVRDICGYPREILTQRKDFRRRLRIFLLETDKSFTDDQLRSMPTRIMVEKAAASKRLSYLDIKDVEAFYDALGEIKQEIRAGMDIIRKNQEFYKKVSFSHFEYKKIPSEENRKRFACNLSKSLKSRDINDEMIVLLFDKFSDVLMNHEYIDIVVNLNNQDLAKSFIDKIIEQNSENDVYQVKRKIIMLSMMISAKNDNIVQFVYGKIDSKTLNKEELVFLCAHMKNEKWAQAIFRFSKHMFDLHEGMGILENTSQEQIAYEIADQYWRQIVEHLEDMEEGEKDDYIAFLFNTLQKNIIKEILKKLSPKTAERVYKILPEKKRMMFDALLDEQAGVGPLLGAVS
jgi:disulfide oxidoreductase YuzD